MSSVFQIKTSARHRRGVGGAVNMGKVNTAPVPLGTKQKVGGGREGEVG